MLCLQFPLSCLFRAKINSECRPRSNNVKPGFHFKNVTSEYFTQNPFNTLGPRAFFTMRPLYMLRLWAPWDQGCGWWKRQIWNFAISTRRTLGDYEGASFFLFLVRHLHQKYFRNGFTPAIYRVYGSFHNTQPRGQESNWL